MPAIFNQLKAVDIKSGIALLPDTSVESAAKLISQVDHVLIFGGRLGYQGSNLQKENLVKLKQAKSINPNIETGWDGGVNDSNAAQVSAAGADVINVGGFIQKSEDPEASYNRLVEIVNRVGNDSSGT